MKRAAISDGPAHAEERKKAKKDVLSVGPSHKASEQLPLDRSHLVVHRELTKSQAGMTSLHEFVESINDQLMKTGLAVVSIEQMPRSLQHLRQRPKETVELLGKLLGSRYHFATYSYSLEKEPSSEGAYHVKYKRQGKTFTAQKAWEYAQECDVQGPFAGLPKEGAFTDSQYWAKVEAAAKSGELVHYPADIHATLLGQESISEGFPKNWNMAMFDEDNDLLRGIMPHFDFRDNNLPGCTDSMLYIGAAGTTFMLHAEDQNLFSCNYLLAGAPKVWNGVPSGYYNAVVELVRKVFTDVKLTEKCPQAVMHKRFLLRPEVLRAHGIPTCRLVQRPGDLVITGPGAFHFGYNTGFNVAEATNFATAEWWSGGHLHDAVAAGPCQCKEAPRFHFPIDAVQEALEEEGERFGIDAAAPVVRKPTGLQQQAAGLKTSESSSSSSSSPSSSASDQETI